MAEHETRRGRIRKVSQACRPFRSPPFLDKRLRGLSRRLRDSYPLGTPRPLENSQALVLGSCPLLPATLTHGGLPFQRLHCPSPQRRFPGSWEGRAKEQRGLGMAAGPLQGPPCLQFFLGLGSARGWA